jgi:hypothetical protein
MSIPGFTAEASVSAVRAEFGAESVPHLWQHRVSLVHPALWFGSPCGLLCRRCVQVGGDCIHIGNGRCVCA